MSITGSFFHQLRKQIERDELASVLQQLRILLNNSSQVREIIRQQERFADIHQRIRLGKADFTEADLTQTQIAQGLLDLIRELEQQSKNPALGAELAEQFPGYPEFQENLKWAQSALAELEDGKS